MVWVNIPDTDIDQDSPVTVALATAWRDNPIAIAEGLTGAPRVEDAALSTTVTNLGQGWVLNRITDGVLDQITAVAGSTWVGARTAGIIANAIGSYVLANRESGLGFLGTNSGIPGSQIRTTSSTASAGGSILSGTWRVMGVTSGSDQAFGARVTLFLRVA